MNVENILKVAAAIEAAAKPDAKPKVGFNMRGWHYPAEDLAGGDRTGHDCGTTCCIGGWANVVLHPKKRFKTIVRVAETYETMARVDLGLSEKAAEDLFYPGGAGSWDASPARAAAVLRHLVATGAVDWNIPEPADAP